MHLTSKWLRPIFTVVLLLMVSTVFAELQFDLTPGVTEVSQEVFKLHRLMLITCTVIGSCVFLVMFYSILKHRKSKGHKAAQFHESTTVEIIWTVIPFLILIAMAIPATRVLIKMADTDASALTIKVTGLQWKWHYEYLEYDGDNTLELDFMSNLSTPREQFERPLRTAGLFPVGAASYEGTPNFENKGENYLLEVDNPVVIPTGRKVRFLITAGDVIHSWFVPAFGIKRDAIPGFVNEIWTKVPEGQEGIYRGQCTELCGKDHGFMPVVVDARSPEEFEQWLADAQEAQRVAAEDAANSVDATFTMEELMKEGEAAYIAKCAACHQPNGKGLPPTFPALAGADIAVNKDRVQDHIDIIYEGKGAMPAFKDILTPKEFAAIVTYERNAWGNDTSQVVQPKDVVRY